MNSRILIPVAASLVGLILGASSGLIRGNSEVRPLPSEPSASIAAKTQLTPQMGDARQEASNEALNIAGGEMDLRQLARLEEAFSLIDPEQISVLMDQVESKDSPNRRDRLKWFFMQWYQHDPERANAWIQKRLSLLAQDGPLGSDFFWSSRYQLFEAWTKANPKDALSFARLHPRSGIGAQLLQFAIDAWPDQSGNGRMAIVMEFPTGKAREDALEKVLAKWAEGDPAAAIDAARILADSNERKQGISAALRSWAKKDAEGAFAKYIDLGISDVDLANRLLGAVAMKNPTGAVEFLAQLAPGHVAKIAPQIVATWAERDPRAALTWALENGVGLAPLHETGIRFGHSSFGRESSGNIYYFDPLQKAFQKQPKAVLEWVNQLPPGADRDRITERVIAMTQDLDQALALFSRLPPDAAARTAGTVAHLFNGNPNRAQEAQQWAASLPEGRARTRALASLGPIESLPPGPLLDLRLSETPLYSDSTSSVRINPVPALESAMQISDPMLRRDVLDELVEFYNSIRPAGWKERMLEWLEKSDVPENWKKEWIGQIKNQ